MNTDLPRIPHHTCAACGEGLSLSHDDHINLTAYSHFRQLDKLPCDSDSTYFHRSCYQVLAAQAPWLPRTTYDKVDVMIYSDGYGPSRPRTADELPPVTIPALPEPSPAPFVDEGVS